MTDILNIIFYALKDLSMCAALVMASAYLLGGKIKKSVPATLIFSLLYIVFSVVGVNFILGTAEDAAALMDAISIVITVCAVFFFVKEVSDAKKLSVMLICGFTVDMFFSLFSPYIPKELYAECIVNIILYAAVCILAGYAMKTSSVNFMPQVFNIIPRWIIFALVIFDFTCYCKQFGVTANWYNILYIISSLGVIVCVLYFVGKIFSLTYQQNLILKQFQEQKEYSEKMLTGDENLRKFRHDYKNHMIVINALLERGDTDRAREYLNALNSNINDSISRISTGNVVADAILNNKAVVAAGYDCTIKFSGQIPAFSIADNDLCTILANVVDNAIEAAREVSGSKKAIRIQAAVRNSMFVLSVSNPVKEDITIRKHGLIKTTKSNKNEHGYGMKNIQKTVKKYAGNMNLSCENKIFTVDIGLRLEETDQLNIINNQHYFDFGMS